MMRSRPYAEEKLCTRCREWWPCDVEFFRLDRPGVWHSWCRACEAERIAERRAA